MMIHARKHQCFEVDEMFTPKHGASGPLFARETRCLARSWLHDLTAEVANPLWDSGAIGSSGAGYRVPGAGCRVLLLPVIQARQDFKVSLL